jgi:Protein of unknown function (DUF1822)
MSSIIDRSAHSPLDQPQPGEIWEVNCSLPQEQSSSIRYLTIVREPQAPNLAVCSAMLLSLETQYLSDVDVLIPAFISGLERDVLAETWNVGNLSIDLLRRRVGNRLSRQIYDLLLSIGDHYHGLLVEIPSSRSIQTLGLKVGSPLADLVRHHDFQNREQTLLHHLNPAVISQMAILVEGVIENERELLTSVPLQIHLSQWFQQIIIPEWQNTPNLDLQMAIATRSSILDDQITETITKLKSSDSEINRRQLITKLGSIARNSDEALQTIVELIETTQDDETLWIAVASLRQLAPADPRGGVRKSRSIDLTQSVNFVVNIIPKINNRVGILLQVYPAQSTSYLPTNLKLILQDEAGKSLREVIATSEDRCIQLKLSGVPREIFSICLELDGIESIADFVI